jgi:hypothetical protein
LTSLTAVSTLGAMAVRRCGHWVRSFERQPEPNGLNQAAMQSRIVSAKAGSSLAPTCTMTVVTRYCWAMPIRRRACEPSV